MKPDTLKENWTRFPNNILDNIHLFTPAECKILMVIVRQNVGFRNSNTSFSQTYLEKKTKMTIPTIKNAINSLLEKETICALEEKGIQGASQYSINWNLIDDKNLPPIKNLGSIKNLPPKKFREENDQPPKKFRDQPPKKFRGLKESNYKEIIKNKEIIGGIENNSPQTLSFNLNENTSRNIIFKLKGIPELIQTIFHAHLSRPTKVLSQVDAFIRGIINKQFKYTGNDFDEKWFKNKGIAKALELISGITQGDEEAARRLIKKALLNFKKMKFNDKYWPNEDWIKRIQVDNFFYNPQTRKSWFLDCLVNSPVLTKEYLTLTKVNSIKENFSKIFEINSDDLAKNLYKYNRGYEKWEAPDWVTFFYTSKEIFQWWKDNRENLRLLNDSFHSYIGDSQQWLQVLSEFLENVFPEPKPKFLNLQNGSWSVFENWMREERGIELKINQKEIDDKREYYKRLKDREIEEKIQERVNELAILIEEHDGVEPDFMELRTKVLEDMRKEGVEVLA